MLIDSNSERFPSHRPEIRQEIELRYKQSLANKIYTFPRPIDEEEDSSLNSLKDVTFYDLNEQNYKKMGNIFYSKRKSRKQDSFEKEMKKIDDEISYYLKKYDKPTSYKNNNDKTEEIKDLDHLIVCPSKKLKRSAPSYLKLLYLLMKNNRKSISRMKTPSKSKTPSKEKKPPFETKSSKSKTIETIDDIIKKLTPQKKEKKEKLSNKKVDKQIIDLIKKMKKREHTPSPIKKLSFFEKRDDQRLKNKPNEESFRKNYHESSKKKYDQITPGISRSESRHYARSSVKQRTPINFNIDTKIAFTLENLNLNLSIDDLALSKQLELQTSPNYLTKLVKIIKFMIKFIFVKV